MLQFSMHVSIQYEAHSGELTTVLLYCGYDIKVKW